MINKIRLFQYSEEIFTFTSLINKILLFKYSQKIFSSYERDQTLTLKWNWKLIIVFPTSYELPRNSLFWPRYKPMNIGTIEIG